VTGFTLSEGTVEIDTCNQLLLVLPTSRAFSADADLTPAAKQ
jgi:hypothetical protein